MRLSIIFLSFLSNFVFAASAPNFQGDLMDGGRTSLKEELAKGKPLLLSFWATWCSPCLDELDHVGANLKQEALNLSFLTVNADTSETSAQVKPTYRLHKFSFPVIQDPKHDILNKYHSDGTLPFSVLISPSGQIVETFNGYSEGMYAKIKNYVQKQDQKSSAPAKTEAKPTEKKK